MLLSVLFKFDLINYLRVTQGLNLRTYDDVISGDTEAGRDDAVVIQLVVDRVPHALD